MTALLCCAGAADKPAPHQKERFTSLTIPFLFPLAAAILAGMAGEFQSSTFIGRAVESRRLDALLERAEQGSPQVVLLAGDAGVGKTRLLLALADRARQRGTRVLMGASVELGDIGLAYLPVVDARWVAVALAGQSLPSPAMVRRVPRRNRPRTSRGRRSPP